MQEEKAKGKKQTTLDGLLKNVPKEFSRDGILQTVSQFIACGDQVMLSKLLTLILLTLQRLGTCGCRQRIVSELPRCNEAEDDT